MIFESYSNPDLKVDKFTEIMQIIESNIVNNPISVLQKYNNLNQDIAFFEKKYRDEYFQKQLSFTKQFINFSNILNSKNIYQRQEILKFGLEKINMWFNNSLRNTNIEIDSVYKYLFKGIVWPIEEGKIILIIGIIPHYSYCFNTKNRALLKIVFEIINIEESILWDKIIGKNNLNKLYFNQTSLIENNNNFNLIENDVKEKRKTLDSKLKQFVEKIKPLEKKDINKKNERSKSLSKSTFNLKNANFKSIMKEKMELNFDPLVEDAKHFNLKEEEDKDFLKLNLIMTKSISVQHSFVKNNINSNYISIEIRLQGMNDPFKEKWEDIVQNAKKNSEMGKFDTYNLKSLIIKANDCLNQEQLIMQVFTIIKRILVQNNVKIFIQTYNIMIISKMSGVIG